MTIQDLNIKVCSPKDMFADETLKLSLTSHAAAINPIGWKDVWLLSPFSHVKGGVAVPGIKGKASKTVENVCNFSKFGTMKRNGIEKLRLPLLIQIVP